MTYILLYNSLEDSFSIKSNDLVVFEHHESLTLLLLLDCSDSLRLCVIFLEFFWLLNKLAVYIEDSNSFVI